MDNLRDIEAMQSKISEQDEEIFRLNYLIDSLPGCIYWKDKDGRYLGLNQFTLNRLNQVGINLSKQDIINKTDFEIFDQATALAYRDNDLEIMRIGKQLSYEEKFKDDGNVIQLSTKTPLKDSSGEIAGIIGNTVDISDKAHLIDGLRNAKERAEQESLSKATFLRNMEHDIRTPLVGMIGLSGMLDELNTDKEQLELIADVKRCAEQLLDYCNTIFELSKNEDINMRVDYQPILLEDLLNEVTAMFSPAIISKSLHIQTHIGDSNHQRVVRGDHYRLQRILLNLVGNAVKFTDTGFVKITLSVSQKSVKPSLDLIVEDSGIGIPDDKIDFIFERFTKVSRSNKGSYPGLGLGLPIVKTFVHDLGGSIHVASKLHQGTCITCSIPIPDETIK
ncbi:MAG: hypothetical protein CMF43_05560 [Legionellales bacterium]|nr:hypothetical protein [Legionellales bacterium]|tara:strand:+ start:1218 stop:2393 length:1176 start_codon:yes stop_codon:yes gene_type:complete